LILIELPGETPYVLYWTALAAATHEEDRFVRIGMFADMYKPHISGVTNCIALHKRRLEECGHEVFVITFGNRDHHDDEPNVMRSWGLAFGDTGYQFGVDHSSDIKRLIPTLDIAHAHHPFVSGRLALKYCSPAGVPVVFTNHTRYDLYSDAYAGFVPRTVRMAYLRRYLSWFAEKTDGVFAPSKGLADWLADFGVTNQAVIVHNAIDTRPFSQPSDPRTKTELGFPEHATVMVYLGRMGKEKSIETLIEAFAIAAKRCPELHVLLLGEGPERGSAERTLAERGLAHRANFVGETPYELVPGYLAACDFFVTASTSETYPLVVLEAAAAGLPVAGVRSPGVGDVVVDGSTGLLSDDSAPALADCIERMASDEVLRLRLSEQAKDAAASYDITLAADITLDLYREIIDARRARSRVALG